MFQSYIFDGFSTTLLKVKCSSVYLFGTDLAKIIIIQSHGVTCVSFAGHKQAEEAARARVSVIAHEESYVVFVVRHGESVDNASGDRYSGITVRH